MPSLSSLWVICVPLHESRREKETPGRRQAASLPEPYGEKQGCRREVRTMRRAETLLPVEAGSWSWGCIRRDSLPSGLRGRIGWGWWVSPAGSGGREGGLGSTPARPPRAALPSHEVWRTSRGFVLYTPCLLNGSGTCLAPSSHCSGLGS